LFADTGDENVAAGRYPHSPHVHIHVNSIPGKPNDSSIKECPRLQLSQEWRATIAMQEDSDAGFIPLDVSALAAELAKCE
jgi:hypothetical protein